MTVESRDEPPLATMPTTRRAILTALKRNGPLYASELADALAVSTAAVRQQLARLSEDGLVTHQRDREHRGRPAHRYELSRSAESLFPKRYGDLTTELLGYLGGPEGEEVTKLFEQRRRRRLDAAEDRLAGLSLAEQVAELARILDEDGYLAEHKRLGRGRWLVTEHNCAILSVAQGYRQACSSEIAFIRDALPGAKVQRVAHVIEGAHVCAYEITSRENEDKASPRKALHGSRTSSSRTSSSRTSN
jgi:DeoR family transcriptional regulator, suf operon transcriptional repressor